MADRRRSSFKSFSASTRSVFRKSAVPRAIWERELDERRGKTCARFVLAAMTMFGTWFSIVTMLRTRSSSGAKLRLDVDVHVDGLRVDHRVGFERVYRLEFEEVFAHCGVQDAQVDGLCRLSFAIEFASASSKREGKAPRRATER
jgi:hypothetical protein